mgnify:CR=1 FL=1
MFASMAKASKPRAMSSIKVPMVPRAPKTIQHTNMTKDKVKTHNINMVDQPRHTKPHPMIDKKKTIAATNKHGN